MSRKSRVLFVYPNERKMSIIPPAIAILSQLLKKNGHVTGLFDTTFYDFDDEISIGNVDKGLQNRLTHKPVSNKDFKVKKKKNDPADDLRKKIIEFSPDLLAVSCTETTFARGLKLIMKTRDMGIKNIFGGVFPTFAP